ncbi:DUF2306 domain-containing protein [Domibacillus mangrovi]|uniref:DUF2306 domain-containing protein n=1 Tax=Domibacillus mangrovi TaxID=1714354 RepID=A0A1Q5P044_9BACI|nr:DUF2306 domain-containing protein [Domibacillus mangrovi]OKL35634.1 DUF2306 domain-containing protein [Domibacillus mangrovi]
MDLFQGIKILHIIGGFTALFTFWLPVVTKKGGRLHRLFGWVYVGGMTMVALSAFYMGIYRLLDPSSSVEMFSFSLFLLFISILSSSTVYYGIRVLRFKGRKGIHKNVLDIGFPILLLTSAICISVYGFIQEFVLLSWFPLLGVFLGATQLTYWLQKPKKNMHWWFEHFSGMLGCSIATITAFTVFGAPRLLNIEAVSIVLWFLPTIIVTPVIIGLAIYYTKKFNGKKKPDIPT